MHNIVCMLILIWPLALVAVVVPTAQSAGAFDFTIRIVIYMY